MDNATDILTGFVLEKLPTEPIARRAEIYRALAHVASPAERAPLEQAARECDTIRATHEQLVFDFNRRIRSAIPRI
ncbi:MAG: hypothetical protein V4773_28775 [Verrucomicrobiota bacterium]